MIILIVAAAMLVGGWAQARQGRFRHDLAILGAIAALLVALQAAKRLTVGQGLMILALLPAALNDMQTHDFPSWLVGLAALAALSGSLFDAAGPHPLSALAIGLPLVVADRLWPRRIGRGDIELLTIMGLYFGWQRCLTISIIGYLAAAAYILAGPPPRLGRKVAFVPFITLAVLVGIQLPWG